jgi:uncharacterized protein YkwD/uncharacterized protein YjdB
MNLLIPRILNRWAAVAAAWTLTMLAATSVIAQKTTEGFRPAPGSTPGNAPEHLSLQYQVSMRSGSTSSGWMGWMQSGMAGVSDQGFSVEAMQAKIEGAANGGIWYAVYTSDNRWLPWRRNGETAGAESQQGRTQTVQAIAVRLYNCPVWSVEYRVYVPQKGWLDWVRDGQAAGTIGLGGSIEAIELRLQSNAPETASLVGTQPPPSITNARSQLTQLPKAVQPMATPSAPQQSSTSSNEPLATVSMPPHKTEQVSQPTTPSPQPSAQQQPQQQQSFGQTAQQVGQAVGAIGQTAQQLGQSGQQQQSSQGQWNQQSPQNSQGQWNQQSSQGQWNQQQPQGQWNQSTPPNTQPMGSPASNTLNAPNATPVFLPMASRQIALMAHNGRYVSGGRDARGNVVFTASRTAVTDMETFQLDFLHGHKVALKAVNGRYVGLGQGWGNAIAVATASESITNTEVFEVVSAGADRVAFRAANGMHLGVDEFSSFRLYLKDGVPGWWETFVVMQPNGTPLLGGQQMPAQQSGQQSASAAPVMIYDRSGNAVQQNGGAERLLSAMTTGGNAPPSAATPANTNASSVDVSKVLSTIEREILEELNVVRSRPNDYATLLEGYRRFYKGKTYQPTGKAPVTTKEGVRALDNAITALRTIRGTLPKLEFSMGLSRAARDHVEDAGRRGLVGHIGSDRSNPNDRAARYGTGIVGENCSYGPDIARDIVVQLLIDDGTRDRAHQKNILNPVHKVVGVAFGGHRTLRWMSTQVFAADFKEK